MNFSNQLIRVCLALSCSTIGTTAQALGCDFWGDFAVTAQGDYETRLSAGQSNAIDKTTELLGYEYTDPGSMGQVYLRAVLDALEARLPEDQVFEVGKSVCLSYPEGTFDPDSIE